jgi:hypothetical protein
MTHNQSGNNEYDGSVVQCWRNWTCNLIVQGYNSVNHETLYLKSTVYSTYARHKHAIDSKACLATKKKDKNKFVNGMVCYVYLSVVIKHMQTFHRLQPRRDGFIVTRYSDQLVQTHLSTDLYQHTLMGQQCPIHFSISAYLMYIILNVHTDCIFPGSVLGKKCLSGHSYWWLH